ncbi:thiamine pyrophosphate-binding protein [Piscinibacter sp.]|uniref:thiamine pyrophosphate-binding protein n=1 Tax=Piscinibacter sp. TaxID=1903157 RepID=UPI002CF66FB6|nr:thiamine pyrophosphate-binding protein [Albitalea sp.]HUG21880.1 thiamine pyrophosphate-binding protein [Albitalea sp.]
MDNWNAAVQKAGIDRRVRAEGSEVGDTPRVEGAEVIVRYLERLGVKHVFGVPGGAIEPIYNALARSERRGGVRAVVARHEAGAAFMADGYARETGKIGVAIATSGPGATNLITGVACAYANHVPMLVITGQPPIHSFGKGALQDSSCSGINTVGMFRHCTRYNSLVSHADQLEIKLVSALMQACQTPGGPAHLSIPVDILRAEVRAPSPTADYTSLLRLKPSMVDLHAVRELQGELERAARPVFLIGNGCGEAIEAILKLAEATNALFITTPDGKGFINPRHRAYRGVFGFGGHASADTLLRSVPDLVVAFGTGFGEFNSAGWCGNLLNGRLIHVDSSEENLMRSPMARLHVRGRILSVCAHLLESLGPYTATNVVELVDPHSEAGNPHVALHAAEQCDADTAPIKPQRLMKELSRRFPPNTRFLADAGNSMTWAIHYLQPRNRRAARSSDRAVPPRKDARSGTASWLRVTTDFASMGWAIGAAVGVARGNPDCPVVCITGDGSYLMSGQEITVAAAEGLSIVFIVLNDAAYGMVMHGQRMARAEPIGFDLPQVDYRLLALSMGIPGHVIDSPADLDALDLDEILQRKGPTMLDVRIDREEVPPMFQRLKALGSVK